LKQEGNAQSDLRNCACATAGLQTPRRVVASQLVRRGHVRPTRVLQSADTSVAMGRHVCFNGPSRVLQ
jgi:hypothetical protein